MIVGDTVVVTSKDVPEPVGVQYAYSAAPQNANLYNKAGLPATPFAAVDGKLIFEEDDLEKVAAEKAKYAHYTDPDYPVFQVAAYYRDGAIIQRDQPIPVWGYANKGVEVTVTLGGVTRSAVANDRQQWSVSFPALKASTQPITLAVKASHGHSRTVQNILVGDVWFLTGSTLLTSEPAYDRRDKQAAAPEAMPLVREFRRRTAASTNPTPRKRGFEVGGDRKYRSFWQTADFTSADDCVTMFAYEFAKALNRPGIPQGFVTMSSGTGDTDGFAAVVDILRRGQGCGTPRVPGPPGCFAPPGSQLRGLQEGHRRICEGRQGGRREDRRSGSEGRGHVRGTAAVSCVSGTRAGRRGQARHGPHLCLQLVCQPAHADGCGRRDLGAR